MWWGCGVQDWTNNEDNGLDSKHVEVRSSNELSFWELNKQSVVLLSVTGGSSRKNNRYLSTKISINDYTNIPGSLLFSDSLLLFLLLWLSMEIFISTLSIVWAFSSVA